MDCQFIKSLPNHIAQIHNKCFVQMMAEHSMPNITSNDVILCQTSQTGTLLDCLLYPKKERIALNPLGSQDLGRPQDHNENSSIFEPVSKATKAMKIVPKVTRNHEKSTLGS